MARYCLKLSAILRIADAMDRTHSSFVKTINVKLSQDFITFFVENNLNEIEIELWSLDRKKQLFEEIFERKVKVESNK